MEPRIAGVDVVSGPDLIQLSHGSSHDHPNNQHEYAVLAINRKVLRDIWQLKTQLLAIALVIGCGVATLVMAWSMLSSLRLTLDSYYEKYRFAHVFAYLKRAPQALESRIAQIDGVGLVQTRIVCDVTLDLPNSPEPAIGRLISLPGTSHAGLNLLHLRLGRWPTDNDEDEVLVSEGFAAAHRLAPGDRVLAVLNGRQQRLNIVGVALSPEYIYQIRGGELMPNDRTFGVFWMRRQKLAAAFDMEGAFNDALIYLSHASAEATVIDRLDRLLDRYGGLGSYGREMQSSNRYVTNELRELQNMGFFAPLIFLVVAAFLLNVVLSRIIGTQREQIAALRAFGYTRWEIGTHYLKITMLVVATGVLGGVVAGMYMGRGMTQMYSRFFRFPVLEFQLQPAVIGWSVLVSAVFALLGIWHAVRRAVSLPPAAAMQPEPPTTYRPSLLERVGLKGWLDPSVRLILRHLERRPWRTTFSVLGLALAVAAMVLGNHAVDAIDALLEFQFSIVQRYNVSVGFIEPTTSQAIHELEHLPGVLQVEPLRGTVALFRSGHHSRRQDILALPTDPQLFRLIDKQGHSQSIPDDGLLISTKLATLLNVQMGDELEIAVLEGKRPVCRLPIRGLIDDMIGTSAYLRLDVLQRVLREGNTISGAFLLVESDRLRDLYRELKTIPRVAGVSAKEVVLRNFRDTLASTILRMRAINLIFASIIACGVVYNSARITVAERSRDLASLRVLGYTRGEISAILLGELAILTIAAIPVGLLIGYGFVVLASKGYDTELFRIPVVVYRGTYALAAASVIVASIVSGLIVRRRLDTLDLVAVLKARD